LPPLTSHDAPPSDVPGPAAPAPSPFRAGLVALRRFWRPLLLIQASAILLVIAYHLSAAVRAACDAAADAKARGGLPFAAVTGAFAGGILPELAKLVTDPKARDLRGRGGAIAFNAALFAFSGVLVDLLYRYESHLFGQAATVGTVASKTAFDQFVFTPLWSAFAVTMFAWRQSGFSPARTWRLVDGPFFRNRLLPLLLSNWCFWIPMVSIIYALPAALQFLLFILVLAAWSLIMVFIAAG